MSTTPAELRLSPAESLSLLPAAQREAAIRRLTNEQAWGVYYDWRGFWARPNQLPPVGDWTHWLLLAGRGFGKTRVGAETVREWASKPLPGPIHLIAPTAGDIRKVMIEGPTGGLLSCYPPGEGPSYEPSKGHLLRWPNGNQAYCFSADEPERLRGPQCARFWADEIAAWRFGQEAWDNLMFGFRIGDELRSVITTTPKPIKLLKSIMSDSACVVTRGSTYDNRRNLSKQFFKSVITKYEGTRIGRQELLAELLEDTPGALWKMAMIDSTRVSLGEVRWDVIIRIVVAVDPAVTHGPDSNETGIVVAGLTRSGHVIIIDDLSCRESPAMWGRIAVNAYLSRRADRIVGEVNNGGDLVEGNIRAANANVAFRAVHASRGKRRRAEPVAALYEQGRVHHVGTFPEMEQQMCAYVPGMELDGASDSPDRMDALVWAVTELVVDPEAASEVLIMQPAGTYQISSI
jgi:phage terminase large subunit-like protein